MSALKPSILAVRTIVGGVSVLTTPGTCPRCGAERTEWVCRDGQTRCGPCDRQQLAGKREVQRLHDEMQDRTGADVDNHDDRGDWREMDDVRKGY